MLSEPRAAAEERPDCMTIHDIAPGQCPVLLRQGSSREGRGLRLLIRAALPGDAAVIGHADLGGKRDDDRRGVSRGHGPNVSNRDHPPGAPKPEPPADRGEWASRGVPKLRRMSRYPAKARSCRVRPRRGRPKPSRCQARRTVAGRRNGARGDTAVQAVPLPSAWPPGDGPPSPRARSADYPAMPRSCGVFAKFPLGWRAEAGQGRPFGRKRPVSAVRPSP
jgi:hypothetical protein